MDFLADIDPQRAFVAFLTLMGAFGGFPEPPLIFKQFIQNEFARWLLVFVLVYQGGGAQNLKVSLVVTATAYIVVKLLNNFKVDVARKEGFRRY
jgi:hypothetical protein